MTKKRFIKIVMGYGFSRNEANDFAKQVKNYGSYKRLIIDRHNYFTFCMALKRMDEAVSDILWM